MFCQDPTTQYLIVRVTQAGPQAVPDQGSVMTIILIVVFVAALAVSLLFTMGTRRQAIKSGAQREPDTRADTPPLPAAAPIVSREPYTRAATPPPVPLSQPATPAAAPIVSGEPYTRTATPPPPVPLSQPESPAAATFISREPYTRLATPPPPKLLNRQAAPASAFTTPAILARPVTPQHRPPFSAPVITHNAPTPPTLPPVSKPLPAGRSHGLQAVIDIIGNGIEAALTGMDDAVAFIFESIINLVKWIFRIGR